MPTEDVTARRRRRRDPELEPAPEVEASASESRRKDPKPRHIDGSAPWANLKGRDPDKHYVFAYNNDSQAGFECGFQHYVTTGYEVEEYGATGVRPAGVTAAQAAKMKGQPIEMRGMTLLSCSKERFKEIQKYGPHGNSGMEAILQRRAQIFRKDAIPGEGKVGDPRYFRAENTTAIEGF